MIEFIVTVRYWREKVSEDLHRRSKISLGMPFPEPETALGTRVSGSVNPEAIGKRNALLGHPDEVALRAL